MSSLREFAAQLRKLPTTLAQKAATKAAPAITAIALQTFEAGEDAYGNEWAPGDDGHKVTLRKSGALEDNVRYVAVGTRIRVALGVPYAKYQIGKRPVFPKAGGVLPDAYQSALADAVAEAATEELAQ